MMTKAEPAQYNPSMASRKPGAGVPLRASRRNGVSPSAPSIAVFPEPTGRTGHTTMCNLLNEECRTEIEARVLSASSLVVYAGFDGTLAPLVDTPEQARLPEDTQAVLEDLSTRDGVLLAVLSGRSMADLRARVGIPSLVYGGDHGLEIEGPSLRFEHPEAGRRRQGLRDLTQRLTALPLLFPGVHVETKNFTTTIHFRHADEDSRDHLKTVVANLIPENHPEFVVAEGKQSYEIRPRLEWSKGAAVKWIHERIKATDLLPVVIGDDSTDEEAYGALKDAISIRVGHEHGPDRPTSARYCLDGQSEVCDVLQWLLGLWKRRPGASENAEESPARRSGPGLGIKESSPIHSVRVRRSSAIRKRLALEGGNGVA